MQKYSKSIVLFLLVILVFVILFLIHKNEESVEMPEIKVALEDSPMIGTPLLEVKKGILKVIICSDRWPLGVNAIAEGKNKVLKRKWKAISREDQLEIVQLVEKIEKSGTEINNSTILDAGGSLISASIDGKSYTCSYILPNDISENTNDLQRLAYKLVELSPIDLLMPETQGDGSPVLAN